MAEILWGCIGTSVEWSHLTRKYSLTIIWPSHSIKIYLPASKCHQLAPKTTFICQLVKSSPATSWKILHIGYFCHGGLPREAVVLFLMDWSPIIGDHLIDHCWPRFKASFSVCCIIFFLKFSNKLHNIKALIILSHSWSPFFLLIYMEKMNSHGFRRTHL